MTRIIATIVVLLGIHTTSEALPWDSLRGRAIGRAHADKAGSTYSFAFDNFHERPGSITWTEYARAFYNVDFDSSQTMAWLDKLIYDKVANVLSGGHCFGMASLSATMNIIGGYRGFCCPTGTYGISSAIDRITNSAGTVIDSITGGPAEARLRSVIHEMHMHQLSLACVLTYIDQNNSRVSLNGSRMLGLFESAIAREGGPVLANITKSVDPLNSEFMVSHSIVAYKTERYSQTKGRIYVVDPNVCWYFDSGSDSILHQGWYKDGKNYIEIDGPKWRYFGSATSIETAESWPLNDNVVDGNSTGFLICVPVSRVAPAGRSLASLGAAIGNITAGLRDMIEIVIFSLEGTRVKQISTADGRRVFEPRTGALEHDAAKRLDRMVPIPLSMSDGQQSNSAGLHMFASDNPTPIHEVSFVSGHRGAEVTIAGSGVAVTLTTSIPHATIVARIDRSNPLEPRVEYTSTRPGLLAIEAMHVDAAGRGWRMYVPGQVCGPQRRSTPVPLHSVSPVVPSRGGVLTPN